ncbi:UDP-3-O-[3-hydroxymyristoyl] N-acetylglucosamine deacetylase [bacterium CPR1]|nr:UDP-3-O-[3-hydroxymyristoyl] N-acetylglucosamine deacetylase [bacterium CPR1]
MARRDGTGRTHHLGSSTSSRGDRMEVSRPQQTLAAPVRFEGVGIHLGQPARIEVLPAPVDSGRLFVSQGQEIPALHERVSSVERCTVLSAGEVSVSTVEHLLAACAGLQLDNLRILVDGPEVPILDGSAMPFVKAFLAAGVVCQERPARRHVLTRPLFVHDKNALVLALPATETQLEYSLHYQHPMITYQQVTHTSTPESFLSGLAPARTYAFMEEVEGLLERGLARGGDLSNALVIRSDGYTSALRFPDEPVRHKCLDLVALGSGSGS